MELCTSFIACRCLVDQGPRGVNLGAMTGSDNTQNAWSIKMLDVPWTLEDSSRLSYFIISTHKESVLSLNKISQHRSVLNI